MKEIENKKEFTNIIKNSKTPIILDFFAQWCNPCIGLIPFLEELSIKYKNISIYKIDVDNEDCNEICTLYNISCMPTLIFIKDKVSIDEYKIEGANREKIEENIIKIIK